jgi:hypothetical protein
MRIGRLIPLVIGIGLLGGCNTSSVRMDAMTPKPLPTNPPPAVLCSSSNCTVTVTVTIDVPTRQCLIKVDPLILKLTGGPTQTITWTLSPPLVRWPNPLTDLHLPIQFDSTAVGVFSNLTISPNSVSVTYTRPPALGNTYGYGVNTKTTLPRPICSIDPFIAD